MIMRGLNLLSFARLLDNVPQSYILVIYCIILWLL
jgi:hypothetical protein